MPKTSPPTLKRHGIKLAPANFALMLLMLLVSITGAHAEMQTYTNPIFEEGQDPKVAFKDGYYYYVKWAHSGSTNHIYRTRDLADPGELRVLPDGIPLTAPVFIEELNGHPINKWYMFGPGVWECAGDPYTGDWTLKQGDIFNRTQYRLDYYSFFYKGRLFIAWAGNEDPNRQPWEWWFESVFISEITYDGSSFSLVTPDATVNNMVATYSFGPGFGPRFNTSDVVVEAPAVYTPSQFGFEGRDDELFMTLSIDGAQTNYYAMGMIYFTGSSPDEVTDPNKWQKVTRGGSERLFASHNPDQSPTPLAEKGLKGPGVPALAPGPGGSGLWMYYHSKHNDNFERGAHSVYVWIRRVMLQEIGWQEYNGRLLPDFHAEPIVGVGEDGQIPVFSEEINITGIFNQTIFANSSTSPLSFTVGHHEIDPGDLAVSGASSNKVLVPDANIVFGGGGADRTVTVTPAPDQSGTATITITVSDGDISAGTSFVLTVISDKLLIYDFDDATLQGWTDLTPPNNNDGPRHWAISPPAFPNGTHTGSGAVGQHLGGNQDASHPTLWLQSPEFRLNGEGDLTVWLSGGTGTGSLENTAVSSLPDNSSNPGFQGVALRNADTGTFVLSGRKASSGYHWEEIAFSSAQLAALDQEATYTLDLIDAGHGGWGWTAMDSVTIPGTLVDDPVAPELPILVIERRGANEVRLSWPAEATGWTLQRSAEAGGGYTDAGLTVIVEGDENVVYDTTLESKQFYRLAQ